MNNKRGKLVVIEGTDCSGKSSQIKLLVEKLENQGLKVEVLDFPNYSTPTGKIVRKYLDNEFGPANDIDPKIASILFANDRYYSKSIIDKALEENDLIILDRYIESNMGHQGGKIQNSEDRKKFYNWLEELEYENFSMPKPDLIILLHMPHQISLILKENRIRKSENHPSKEDGHESNIEHLKNAEQAYLQLAQIYGWRKIECAPDNKLRTPEEISKELISVVKSIFLKNHQDQN